MGYYVASVSAGILVFVYGYEFGPAALNLWGPSRICSMTPSIFTIYK